MPCESRLVKPYKKVGDWPIRSVLLSRHAFRFPSRPARQTSQANTAVVRPACVNPLGSLIGLTKISALNLVHDRSSVLLHSIVSPLSGQQKKPDFPTALTPFRITHTSHNSHQHPFTPVFGKYPFPCRPHILLTHPRPIPTPKAISLIALFCYCTVLLERRMIPVLPPVRRIRLALLLRLVRRARILRLLPFHPPYRRRQ